VSDADATTAKVTAAGGTTIVEPIDVMTFGRMAMFLDPLGAPFSVWQAGDHIGAAIVNEPNTLCWNEMACRDPEAAVRFYGEVF
jgi:predicted enzyme related to lactoylglutathione lyase